MLASLPFYPFSATRCMNSIKHEHSCNILYVSLFDSLSPISNLSVMKGWVFLGWTSAMLGLTFLLKNTMQWRWWGSNLWLTWSRVKHSATEPPIDPLCLDTIKKNPSFWMINFNKNKRFYYECEGGIEKICSKDHHLAWQGLLSDAKRWSRGTDLTQITHSFSCSSLNSTFKKKNLPEVPDYAEKGLYMLTSLWHNNDATWQPYACIPIQPMHSLQVTANVG